MAVSKKEETWVGRDAPALTPEEVIEYSKLLERIGKREMDGCIFIIGAEANAEEDGDAREASGILFSENIPPGQMMINLMERLYPSKIQKIAAIAQILASFKDVQD